MPQQSSPGPLTLEARDGIDNAGNSVSLAGLGFMRRRTGSQGEWRKAALAERFAIADRK